MDTIDILQDRDTAAYHFMISAAVHGQLLGKVAITIADEGKYNIRFEVNGVELPFKAVIQEIYDRAEQAIDKKAGEKAIEMVKGAGLSKLVEEIQSAEWEIREKFRAAGINLGDQ